MRIGYYIYTKENKKNKSKNLLIDNKINQKKKEKIKAKEFKVKY